MTKKQQEFYRMITNQIIDFNEDFHSDFTIQRIEQISDNNLKYLLEDINIDKDKIVNKKGYMTYSKFIYYADKMIDNNIKIAMKPNNTRVEELYKKRALLLHTIELQTKSIKEKNKLIESIKNKTMMFKDNGKNILDEIDYFIIEQFGFYSFFDENKNYMIKEEIEKYFKLYTSNQLLLKQNNKILLT
jgi:tRNA(Met) C34 N-acetyltransferase TmcA